MTPERLAQIHGAAVAPERGWRAAEFAGLLASPHARLVTRGQSFALGRLVADEAEVLMLATEPGAQRQGLARAALTELELVLAQGGGATIFLEVAADNAAAQALYLTAGYEETGRRRAYYTLINGATVDALMMRKRLRPA